MEITIKINGRMVAVEVSTEVAEYMDTSRRKAENLSHERRRHWDVREFDEYIVADEGRLPCQYTPEDLACRQETLDEIFSVLDTCTETQRERFCCLRWMAAPTPRLAKCVTAPKWQYIKASRPSGKNF